MVLVILMAVKDVLQVKIGPFSTHRVPGILQEPVLERTTRVEATAMHICMHE